MGEQITLAFELTVEVTDPVALRAAALRGYEQPDGSAVAFEPPLVGAVADILRERLLLSPLNEEAGFRVVHNAVIPGPVTPQGGDPSPTIADPEPPPIE